MFTNPGPATSTASASSLRSAASTSRVATSRGEAPTGMRLELTRVAVRNIAKERAVAVPPGTLTHDSEGLVTADDVDVVVETIGGIEPARGLILDALKAGKPVVTANKELLANVG